MRRPKQMHLSLVSASTYGVRMGGGLQLDSGVVHVHPHGRVPVQGLLESKVAPF